MFPQESEAQSRVSRTDRINVRANAQQVSLIRRAAEARGKTVTDFVLDSATVTAEHVLADRRWFQLSDEAWHTFETLLDRPAVFKPRLSRSMSEADPFVD